MRNPLPVSTDAMVGVILAGGLSRRMAGRDKCLIPLGGKPMIAHVAERLVPQVSRLLINANSDPERFAALALPVQADTVTGYAGPLAGVLAGMRWAAKNAPTATHILTAAADTPFFPADLARNFVEALDGASGARDETICLATSGGHRHPVFGLWPVALADPLERFLTDEATRKVMAFVSRYRLLEVPFDPGEAMPGSDPFFNINTPEELAEAHRLLHEVER